MLKSKAEAKFRTPPLQFKTPKAISMSCQIYYYAPQGVDVQNLARIDSIVTDLRMREKTRFCVDFLLTYLSVCMSDRFFFAATDHSVSAILTLNGSNNVFSQPLLPFWWSH